MSREVIGSGGADRAGDAVPEAVDLDLDRPDEPGQAPGASRVGARLRAEAGGLALLAVVAGGVVHARTQQARELAANRVAVSVQGARPVGELRTFTDPTGPHAFMTVAVGVLSQGPAPLRVVDARLVGPGRAVPLRYPTTLAPGQVSDLEVANLDPCPAPLGLTSVLLTYRSATGSAGTLTLPVPGGFDALSASCPQPGRLPLQGGLVLARADAYGSVVANIEVSNSGSRAVRVDGTALQAGSADVGAGVEPAAPFDVPPGAPGRPGTREVTITLPPPPCAPGMFSTWNDVGSAASLGLAYETGGEVGDGAEELPTVTLVVDLGEQWKAARRAAMGVACAT